MRLSSTRAAEPRIYRAVQCGTAVYPLLHTRVNLTMRHFFCLSCDVPVSSVLPTRYTQVALRSCCGGCATGCTGLATFHRANEKETGGTALSLTGCATLINMPTAALMHGTATRTAPVARLQTPPLQREPYAPVRSLDPCGSSELSPGHHWG